MNLPFHLIIEYAKRLYPDLVQSAYSQFFSSIDLPNKDQEQDAHALFSEWLIYDFHEQDKSTFLAEYFLKNPDNLGQSELAQIEQVIQTNWYGGFQIGKRKKNYLFEVEHLFSGRKIIIYDKQGYSNLPDEGTIISRVALVDGRWYLVGANPLYLPQTYTLRMKRIMRKNANIIYSTPRDAWELLKIHREQTPQPPKVTEKQIAKKREELRSIYQTAMKTIPKNMPFSKLIKMIYEENGIPPLDVWSKIMKAGLSNKLFHDNIQLFSDIWNYFPHKIINDKCPVALFNKLSGVKVK